MTPIFYFLHDRYVCTLISPLATRCADSFLYFFFANDIYLFVGVTIGKEVFTEANEEPGFSCFSFYYFGCRDGDVLDDVSDARLFYLRQLCFIAAAGKAAPQKLIIEIGILIFEISISITFVKYLAAKLWGRNRAEINTLFLLNHTGFVNVSWTLFNRRYSL